MKQLLTLVLASGLLLNTGCAAGGGPESELRSRQPEPTRVEVSNNNWLDVNVFAVRANKRIRLGMVTSMSTRVLSVPHAFLAGASSLQLVADPIGSQSQYSSDFMSVWPGQVMSFAVENQLSLSRVITLSN